MEDHGVALGVASEVGGLGPAEAPVDEALDEECASVERPFEGEPLANGGVNLAAHRVGRGEHRGPGAGIIRQREPDAPCGLAECCAVGLLHALAQSAQCQVRRSLAHMGDGGGECGVALAQHLVHHRRCHPRLLEHPERLAGVHRLELPCVAEEHDAGDLELLRNPKERLHLHRANHRRLVDGEHGACERLPAPGEALGVGEVVESGEKPLERARLDAGAPSERPDGSG